MRTLPREPWRGGQICGYQTAYGLPWSIFCGEFKKPGSPLCPEHDKEVREEHGGALPRFAPGNALGLEITSCSQSWLLRDGNGMFVDAADAYEQLRREYFFLRWEPYEGTLPIVPTEKELASFETQLKEVHTADAGR
jgi:hypothetical protein